MIRRPPRSTLLEGRRQRQMCIRDRAKGIKERAGKRFARRLEQQKSQLKQEIAPCLEQRATSSDRTGKPNDGTVLWFLNNSLPFTKSGYTYRTHSSLKAIQTTGTSVQGVTRLGYPVVIGSIASTPVSTVDGVRYRRLIPIRLSLIHI